MASCPSFREVFHGNCIAGQLQEPPLLHTEVKLHSLHAQQVFDRGFELCASAIFSLSVVLRIIGTDQQAREVEGVVDERLNKAFEDIRGEASRLEKLAEANGIEFKGIEYSRPKEVEAKITSPRAVRYLGLIREFDGMVAKLDTLWLSGVVPDGNRNRAAKKITAHREDAGEIRVIRAPDRWAEVDQIVGVIRNSSQDDEWAILARTNLILDAVEIGLSGASVLRRHDPRQTSAHP